MSERGNAEIIDDQEPLLVLAIPVRITPQVSVVAVGTFVASYFMSDDQLVFAADALGLEPDDAAKWIGSQPCWTPDVLLRMGTMARDRLAVDERLKSLANEVKDLSAQLSSTYEEITLLYRLTQKLKLSINEEELAEFALEWLADALPAEALAIRLFRSGSATEGGRHEPVLLTRGAMPIDGSELNRLVEYLQPGQSPVVLNVAASLPDDWSWPAVRQVMLVPLSEGDQCVGWLFAFNNVRNAEFGTVEASLLGSIGAILGIHSGNAELYRQQRDFLASVVRALTAAIDAKDPYTCGHSDRVARVSVRLAQEMGCNAKQLDTIYLSSLLHDIGKIGIDDNVLRNPGKLTEAEYEHIKTHPAIGYKILSDIKQLEDSLPVVLHHHEQWDGRGYPHGLEGEAIPLLARIVAVADSFDAMGSDRPYRSGMSDEKLDSILRVGAVPNGMPRWSKRSSGHAMRSARLRTKR